MTRFTYAPFSKNFKYQQCVVAAMILSDIDIMRAITDGDLSIEPCDISNVEPASVDLRMGDELVKVSAEKSDDVVRLDANGSEQNYQYTPVSNMTIRPGEFYLATTKERVELPDTLCANVLGRSSLGRLGISVHQTAGYIDPGFNGQITLELTNHGPQPVQLREGLRICQIVFAKLSSKADISYGHRTSQYQDQSGATRSGMNFE
jgi:dCTP deaminase